MRNETNTVAKARIGVDRDEGPTTEYKHTMIRRDVITPPDMADPLKSIIEWSVELLRADDGEIYLWDQEEENLRLSVSSGHMELHVGFTLKPGEGMAGRVFQSGEPMIVNDYRIWEGRAAAFDPFARSVAVLQVPMRWQDQIIGVLGFNADPRRRKLFDQDDVQLAVLVANLAAVAIKNARLYKELQHRSDRLRHVLEQEVALRTAELAHRALQLETSAQVSREITSILNIDRLLNRVVELIGEAFDYYAVRVFLVDPKTNRLVLRASSGEMGRQLESQGIYLEIGGGSLNGEVAQANEAMMVNNVSQEPRYLFVKMLPDTKSELVVPLRVGDRVVGTLDVQSKEINAFSQEDMMVIQSLGDQVAIALENAKLYEQARRMATAEERQRLARELHDSVTQSLYSLTLLAEGGRRLATSGSLEGVGDYFADLGEIALQSLKEMRLLVYELRPLSLEQGGLVGALQQRLDAVEGRAGVNARLLVEGEVELTASVEEALYRIAQEALNNALKHATATSVAVQIRADGNRVELEVVDDGRGFDSNAAKGTGGMGLITMRERGERLGGDLTILSVPGEGTRVRVSVEVSQ